MQILGAMAFPRLRSRRFLIGLALPLSSFWFCHEGNAQEWKLDTNLSQQVLYSDNLLLGVDREIETFGAISTPSLRVQRLSPTLDLTLSGRYEFSEYLNHSEFNSQDPFIGINVGKILTERNSLAFKGSFSQDSTLKSELQDETSQFVDKLIQATTYDARPSWTYLLTPVDRVVLGGSYTNVSYDSAEKTDYQYFGSTVDYSHQLSDIDSVTANVSFFRYIPDRVDDAPTDTVSVLGGYSYKPSDRLSFSGMAGLAYSMRDSNDSGDSGSDSDNDGGLGFRLKVNASYKLDERTSGRVSISHDSEPSSEGDQTTRNRLTLGLNHKLTPLTTFSVNLDYVDNFDYAGMGARTEDDDRESRYASVRPAIAWELTEDVSLVAEYRYRYKLYDDNGDSAMSNSVFLTLKYALPTWAWDGY
jgi:hypothetical protein